LRIDLYVSWNLNLYSSVKAVDQVAHPYKATGKVIVSIVLIFTV